MNVNDKIRLFVGADCNNSDLESQAVLEYTLRKHASLPVELTWMRVQKKGPWSGWQTGSGITPFTHFRWSIPAVCGYQGRAVYTDSDFFFCADLAELWRQPIPGVILVKNPGPKVNTSCMLIDCAKAKGHIPDLDRLRQLHDANSTMKNYFVLHPELMSAFEGDWNCVDLDSKPGRPAGRTVDDPRIKALHYSRIEGQLHLKHAIPRLQAEGRRHWYPDAEKVAARIRETGSAHWIPELQARFDQLLAEAIDAGFAPERYRVDPYGEFEKRQFTYQHSRL